MEVKEDVLTAVQKIKDISDDVSVLKLSFEKNNDCYYIGNFIDTLEYQGVCICYTETYQIIEGKKELCATDVQVIHKVNTIEAEEVTKLFPNELPKNDASIAFIDINIGDPASVQTLYCTNISFSASEVADWRILTLMDKNWRIIKCKQFSPADKETSPIGHYIDVKIWKTHFGFNCGEFSINQNLIMVDNPKILLAKKYIGEQIESDYELKTIVANTGLLNAMKTYHLDEEVEAGYQLVKLAQQIYIARSLVNVTNSYDIELLVRYFVLSNLYMLNMKPTTALSEVSLNIMAVARTKLATNGKLLALLDEGSHQVLRERDLIKSINGIVDTLQIADTTYFYQECRKRI